MIRLIAPVLAAAVTLAACEPADAQRSEGGPTPQLPARAGQPPATPTVAAGPERAIPAVPGQELQEAAAVSQLHLIPSQSAKVFSVSGGDPAVNGLVTYLGLFHSPAEGWRVYPIGDYAEWRVIETAPGRLVIAYSQDSAGSDGDIVQRDGRVVVSFARDGDAPPATIRLAEGR